MPKSRKTRAQKIATSQRKTVPSEKTISYSPSLSSVSSPVVSSTSETYVSVLPDLRKTLFLTTSLVVAELIFFYFVQYFKLF